MKYLHIIPLSSNLILPLAQMLRRWDKQNEHDFLVAVTHQSVLKNDPRLLCIHDLECIPSFKRGAWVRRMWHIVRKAKMADHIVWHSFRTNGGYNPFLLFAFPELLCKSTWIVYDGEIGNYANVSNRILRIFAPAINRNVEKRIANIAVSFPSDYQTLRKNGICKPEVSVLPYPISKERVELFHTCVESDCGDTGDQEPLWVQLGMSSQRGNQHKLLIQKLKDVSDYETMHVFVPFRYEVAGTPVETGSKAYEKQIRAKIKKLECKNYCLEKSVSAVSYMEYIKRINAVFLANQSACRLEQFLMLLAAGKRVFLPENSALYQYLNELGAGIQPLEFLTEGISTKDILSCPGAKLPTELMSYFDEDSIAQRWMAWTSVWSKSVKS